MIILSILQTNRNTTFQYSNDDCCKYSPLGGGVHSSVCSGCSFNSMANVHYNTPTRPRAGGCGQQVKITLLVVFNNVSYLIFNIYRRLNS